MMLKQKILIGYSVAAILLIMVVAWAVVNLFLLGKVPNTILHENYRSILAAENMVDALERQDSGILLLFLKDSQEGIDQFRKNEGEFLKWLARAKDNISIKDEEELLRLLETNYTQYRQQFSSLTDFPDSDKEALSTFHSNYSQLIHPTFIKVRQNCIQLRDINQNSMVTAQEGAKRTANFTAWFLIVITAVTLVGSLCFFFGIIEQIVFSTQKLSEAFRKISSNDLTVRVPLKVKGEMGHLVGEFNQMVNYLDSNHQRNIRQIYSEKSKNEAILASIEDGLIIFNTDLIVTDINPAAQRMLFLPPIESSPLKCSEILKGTQICEVLTRIVESGQHLNLADEQRMVTLSQGEQFRHYLFSITTIYENEGKLTGIVLLLRDVTRLKEVERLKNEFILAASHELRTPLSSLGRNIDSLKEQAAAQLGEKEKELLHTAHEEVHRMKALVNDLLDLSKIESGRIAIEFESVSIKTLFNHVQKVFKSQMEQKSVTLAGNFNADLPNIRADANKITWVLSNLVSNAMRYVNDGGHIQFVANRIGPQIHMSVHDDGPGIPLEYQSKIFQKYVQVKGQESGGTGLGLAICKEIVRAHGGGIWVESLPGQGSTFTFTLPIAH